MANKFDKPYIYINTPDQNKINAVLSKSIEMDTQDLLQYSMINKFPLYIVNDKDGNNLMHLGILGNKSEFNILNYVKFLVQQQVNPDQPNKDNQTPLHLACQKQYLTVVKFLLEQHVNINYQDNNGATPLHYLLIGDIKPWEEKEIKEFIVPNPKNKQSKVDIEASLELKKYLWGLLVANPIFIEFKDIFIDILTYDFQIIPDINKIDVEMKNKLDKINEKIKNELENTQPSNNNKMINDIYYKYSQDLNDYIESKWSKFSNYDGKFNDIIKDKIKTNLKNIINTTIKLFDNIKNIEHKRGETIEERDSIDEFNTNNDDLKDIFDNIKNNILTDIRRFSEIYELYDEITNIIENQEAIIKQLNKNIKLFDINTYAQKLNDINSYIYFYYYFINNRNPIPKFIYTKINSVENIELYDNIQRTLDNDLIGGDLNIINTSFQILTHKILPPSLEDKYNEFYQLYKLQIIQHMVPNIDKTKIKNELKLLDPVTDDLLYGYPSKIIEELIKEHFEFLTKQAIYKKIDPNNRLQFHENLIDFKITPSLNININELNTIYDKINTTKDILYNFYKFSDPNISKECKFIIYPNEYNNTNLLQQKYCIKIDEKIICELLNQNAQPYLLDNNNISCLNSIISTFNYKILHKYFEITNSKQNYKDEIKYIVNELNNHINKMIDCEQLVIDCPTIIENKSKEFNAKFVQTQYEEIKLLILSDETYGNNLFYNLKNSFNICFYIMNEYLTDSLWCFDDNIEPDNKFVKDDFLKVINLLKYNKKNIYRLYLSKFANTNNTQIYKDDKTLILIELLKNIKQENELLIIEKTKLEKNKQILAEMKLKNNNICQTQKKITDIETKIKKNKDIYDEIDKINKDKYKSKQYNKNNTELSIIHNYNKLINDEYGIYSSIWELLFSDKQNLDNSHNLSLLKILKIQCKDKHNDNIEKYYDHISKLAHSYFETTKYLDNNNVMKFIYELLVHLTKTQLCFGIEILVRRTLYNHLIQSYIDYDIDILNSVIERILETDPINKNEYLSFKYVLYNILPEKFVKNSVNVFDNLDEKVNFEPQTVLELLRELFESLRKFPEIESSDILLENLNKNIANYFDLFISRTIKNWYVVCENILKFVINQQRITKTLGTLVKKYEQVAIVTVIWSDSATKINKVLVCRRGVKDELENTIMSQGGRVDPGETFEQAAIREAKEEAGIDIQEKDFKLLSTEVVDDKIFKNYYVVYQNEPKYTGPDEKHKSEVKNVPTILTHNTTNGLAFVPIDEILTENESTYFTETLKKIKVILP